MSLQISVPSAVPRLLPDGAVTWVAPVAAALPSHAGSVSLEIAMSCSFQDLRYLDKTFRLWTTLLK